MLKTSWTDPGVNIYTFLLTALLHEKKGGQTVANKEKNNYAILS